MVREGYLWTCSYSEWWVEIIQKVKSLQEGVMVLPQVQEQEQSSMLCIGPQSMQMQRMEEESVL